MAAMTIWDGLYQIPFVESHSPGTSVRSYTAGGSYNFPTSGESLELSVNRLAFSFYSSDDATYPTGAATLLYDRSEPTGAWLTMLPYAGACAFVRDRFYVGNMVHDLDGNYLRTVPFPVGARVVGDRAVLIDNPSSTWVVHVYDSRTGRELGQCDTGVVLPGGINRCSFALSKNRLVVLPSKVNKAVIIDTDSMTVFATVNVGTTDTSAFTVDKDIRVSIWGNLAAVVNTGSNDVTVIDVLTGSVTRTISVGSQPMGISVYRNIAAVTTNVTSSVSLIDISSGATIRTFNVNQNCAYFVTLHGGSLVVSTSSLVAARAVAFAYASGVSGDLVAHLWDGTTEQPASSITTS